MRWILSDHKKALVSRQYQIRRRIHMNVFDPLLFCFVFFFSLEIYPFMNLWCATSTVIVCNWRDAFDIIILCGCVVCEWQRTAAASIWRGYIYTRNRCATSTITHTELEWKNRFHFIYIWFSIDHTLDFNNDVSHWIVDIFLACFFGTWEVYKPFGGNYPYFVCIGTVWDCEVWHNW